MARHATVLGAGISGLTTALAAHEGGFEVRVIGAKTLPGRLDRDYDPSFASLHPAAFLKPLLCDYDPRLWADSFARFHLLSQDRATGVTPTEHWELWEDRGAAPNLSASPWTAPTGVRLYGRVERGLIADLPVYLSWLTGRLEAYGVPIEAHAVATLEAALRPEDEVLFHCSGAAAKSLAGDEAIEPVAGQLLRVKYDAAVPAADVVGQSYHCHPKDSNLTLYSYPRHNRLILGGSQLHLAAGATAPAPFEALDYYDLLFDWNAHLLRTMYGVDLPAATYAYTVGLRPYRHGGVRLEREDGRLSIPVIHNYGHGGGGVSLSWGCAQKSVRLAE